MSSGVTQEKRGHGKWRKLTGGFSRGALLLKIHKGKCQEYGALLYFLRDHAKPPSRQVLGSLSLLPCLGWSNGGMVLAVIMTLESWEAILCNLPAPLMFAYF